MKQFNAKIISNRPLCADMHELVIDWDESAGIPVAGNFFTVRVAQTSAPLLRRPLAFCGYDAKAKRFSAIYLKRGIATTILAGKEAGESLDVLGPLGNAFQPSDATTRCILVAGGIGLGPILFLRSRLNIAGRTCDFVFGAKTASAVPALPLFAEPDVHVCTDDGSRGFAGTTVEYLQSISANEFSGAILYCCGPMPMLKACHEYATGRGLRCVVSVEQIMACGVGACMGCVVKVTSGTGFARACTEGPVFESSTIVWT
jgi:dihydroorotate dehydrogenase electron transfer subunit